MENNNLSFPEFCEYIRDNISSYLPAGLELKNISIREINKNNGQIFHALCFAIPGQNISPTIYLDSFYDSYHKGLNSLNTNLESVSNLIVKSIPKANLDIEFFTDFNKVKDNLYCKLINTYKNEKLLDDVPHKNMEDLSIVYYFKFPSTDVVGEFKNASILIHDSHMQHWGVSLDELHDCALKNVCNQTLVFKSIKDYLMGLYGQEGTSFPEEFLDLDVPMYILSNKDGLFGANCVLNEDFMSDLSKKMDGNFFLFPSSIHEMIVLRVNPEDMNIGIVNQYKEMVSQINSTEVIPEEVLSSSVYMYDSVKKSLVYAEDMIEKRMNEQDKSLDLNQAQPVMPMRRHAGR